MLRGGLVFVDSDDLLKYNALEVLYEEWERTEADFVTASYDLLSEDGLNVTSIEGNRSHGAPWGRLYSREIWRNIDFPEGYWFEDTVQGFLIDSQFTQALINDSVYLYRVNSVGITAKCSESKKGLDSYWILEYLLERCQQFNIPYEQAMHERVVKQLGPILWWRCSALSSEEKRALFVVCCAFYRKVAGNMTSNLGPRWRDLEAALRAGNYFLWKVAILGLS